jgi:hypothetical protein
MIVAKPKSYLWFALACSSAIAAIILAVYLAQSGPMGRSAATQAATAPPETKVGLPLSEVVMEEGEIPLYPVDLAPGM